jgi:hypothetical protein
MAQKMNKNQIIARISMVNGVPRVRLLTAKEQRQFIKTHPNLQLPTFSLEDVNQGLTMLEAMLPRTANPSDR